MCAIFGLWNVLKAAEISREGIFRQQNRASDYTGMVTTDGDNFFRCRKEGLALSVLTDEEIVKLHGRHALAHLRYATVVDDETMENIQPIEGVFQGEPIALAHNGNLTNAEQLRAEVTKHIKLATSMDSELILKLLCLTEGDGIIDCLRKTLRNVRGSYSLGILLRDRLIAVRDPTENRPLWVGGLGEGFCISSEDWGPFDLDADWLEEVRGGQIVEIKDGSITRHEFASMGVSSLAHCVFESVYFGDPASRMFGHPVAKFRDEQGVRLAKTWPVEADIVLPVPDSANQIGIGYARQSGIRLELALLRSHYTGRTFINKSQKVRCRDLKRKFRVARTLVTDRRVVVVDDSIVRLNTMPLIVDRLRKAGASEVHIRIGSPPNIEPCRYGINTRTREELCAASHSIEEMRLLCNADSLKFLSIEELRAIPKKDGKNVPDHYCYACMTREHPEFLN